MTDQYYCEEDKYENPMTSSPFLVKAGSGLSPRGAKLSLTLVFPLPFSAGRHEKGIQLFKGELCSHSEKGLSSSHWSCGTAWWDLAVIFSISLEARNANMFIAS